MQLCIGAYFHISMLNMVNLFSKKNIANIILLLVITFIIQIPLFFNPPILYENNNTGLLSIWVKKYIDLSSLTLRYISIIISYALIVIQALRLNYIVNNQRLYLQYNYLPVLAYITILYLLPNTQILSIPLVLNTIIISILSSLLNLYNHSKPKPLLYNIGLTLGVLILLYTPIYPYAILVFFTLFIMRSFQITEWLITLLGLLTPFYFWYTYLFLTNHWQFGLYLPHISLQNPFSNLSIYTSIALVALVLLLIIGLMYWQKNSSHMIIQVRKNWAILIISLLLTFTIPFIQKQSNFNAFIFCVPVWAAIMANAGLYPRKKLIPSIVCIILLLYGIFIQYIN